MGWLEKHERLLFKANGFFLLIVIIFVLCGIYQFAGSPINMLYAIEQKNWQLIDFLWRPIILSVFMNIAFIVLSFKEYYIVFPLILFLSLFSLSATFTNLSQIIHHGFIHPVYNLLGIFWLLEFLVAIIGTVLWIKHWRKK